MIEGIYSDKLVANVAHECENAAPAVLIAVAALPKEGKATGVTFTS